MSHFTANVLKVDNAELNTVNKNIELVSEWLHANSGWIIVFNGADNDTILGELARSDSMYQYFPHQQDNQGVVIITSKAPPETLQQIMKIENPIVLQEFKTEEIEYFLRVSLHRKELSDKEESALKFIVDNIGGIPLKLEQCAAFIRQRKYSFSDYVRVYQKRKDWPLLTTPYGCKDLVKLYKRDFDKVQGESETAYFGMCAAAYLNGTDIPFCFFEYGIAALETGYAAFKRVCDSLSRVFHTYPEYQDSGVDKSDDAIFKDILYRIRQHNLIKYETEEPSFQINKDVQCLLRQHMKDQNRENSILEATMAMLLHIFLKNPADMRLKQILLIHADTCLQYVRPKIDAMFALYARLKLEVSRINASLNRYKRAESLTENLQTEFKEYCETPPACLRKIELKIFVHRAQICRWLGKVKEATVLMRMCEQTAENASIKGTEDEADMCRWMANALIDEHKLDETMVYLERAKQLYESIPRADGEY